jgi:hypothetical protein
LSFLGWSFEWDTGYFSLNIKPRVKSIDGLLQKQAWESVLDKVVLYDYIAKQPIKIGLTCFRYENARII